MEWLVGKIADYAVEPIGRQIGYLSDYGFNIRNLKEQFQHLKDTKRDLESSLEGARRRGEVMKDIVERWFSEADKISEEVESFLRDEGQANTGCSTNSFPNLVLRHRLSRRAKKMAQSVLKIKEAASRFDKVSGVPFLPNNNILGTKGYMHFDTRNSILEGIMEALGNNDTRMIGVHGMPGVGKTTLAKEVAKCALEAKLFSNAVEVAVSASPKLEEIQKDIADRLDLDFSKKGVKERAVLLRNRLSIEQNFLIILDDVWKKLDLLDMGICFEDEQKGCKILLTSRDEGVLEDDMGVDKNFKVGILSDSEAWTWFSKIVGEKSDENSEFKHCATEIVKKCARLPLAIITVAHALKNKGIHFWKDALTRLQRSSMYDNVYSSVKLSYDFLENEESRSILLFCSLHEEDAEILFDSLLNWCIGLDLFKDVYTLEEARNRLLRLLDELKSRCLLLEVSDSDSDSDSDPWIHDSVKMHDVIRDVGISIAKEFKMYNIRSNEELKKFLDSNKLKDAIAISLGANYEDECLPSKLNCPELLLLSIDVTSLPDTFFEQTKKLRVLDPSYYRPLPSSFCCLENLQALHLDYDENPHLIGELKKLKVLDLSGSSLEQLPEQIGQLTCLRKLDLSRCYSLKVVPPNVISRLVNLEELNMLRSFSKWQGEGVLVDDENRTSASLSEVKHLTKLTALYLQIPHANMLPKDLFSTKLERYHIRFGATSPSEHLSTRKLQLSLEFGTSSLLNECGFQMLLKRSEELYINKFNGLKNIVCELDKEGGLTYLETLHVADNDEIQYMIDCSSMEPNHISDHGVLPSLEIFNFRSMVSLEKICHGELRDAKSLGKLRVAKVFKCNKLKNLLPFSIANKLEEIYVDGCSLMEEIVTFERQDRIEFPKLKRINLQVLPELTRFCSECDPSSGTPDQGRESEQQLYHSDSPSTLFHQKVALPILEDLYLDELNIKRIWVDQLPQTSYGRENLIRSLAQLEELSVFDCEGMEEIIGLIKEPTVTFDNSDDIIQFPKLKKMELDNLPQLIQFCSQSQGQGSERLLFADSASTFFNQKVAFPSLEKLNLYELNSVERIWPNQLPETSKLRNLTTLSVGGCKRLKYVIPFAIAESLVQLKELSIGECVDVEEIIMIKEPKEVEKIDKKLLPKLQHVELSDLPNLARFCTTETNICRLNFVQHLDIKNCPKLWSRSAEKKEDKYMNLQEKISMRSPCDEKVEFSAGLDMSSLNSVRRIPYDPLVPNFTTNLKVENCDTVESLLSASMAKSFVHLRTLEVINCELLKEVVVTEESGYGIRSQKICFPALERLKLRRLPNLEKFCAGDHIEYLLLEKLCIEDCPKLSTFISNSTDEAVPEETDMDSVATQPALFNNQKVTLPKLRILKLERCDSVIEIWQDTKERGQQSAAAGRSGSAFQSLEFLGVSECGSLNKLETNSSVCLEALTVLEVLKCDRMEYIFTPSAAKTLKLLQKMRVSECEAMKEIIASEANHDDKPLVASFHNLELLVLESLPSLTSFHMGNCALEFPKLSRVVVAGNCPELRSFCGHGTIITPKLRTFVRRKSHHRFRNFYTQILRTDTTYIGDPWFYLLADDKKEEGDNIDINTTIHQFWANDHAQE